MSASTSAVSLGAVRSRTLLFLSFRDSTARPKASARRSWGDDPLTEQLLPSEAVEEVRVELPPRWMDVSDAVDELLSAMPSRLAALSRLHEKHLRPGFTDKSAEEANIERTTLAITHDFRRASRLIAGLAAHTNDLIAQAKRGETTTAQVALAQNVQTALASRTQDLSGAFRKIQSLYLRRMKGLEVRDRDIRAAAGTAARDSELAVREDMELSKQQLDHGSSQANLVIFEQEEQQADTEIQNRSREINEIAKSIQDLAQLFGDLQSLVIDQGTMLDRIDYNVELMSREMEGAVKELETATRYQRRSGRRQCILFLVLCIALLIAILIIKPFWRFFTGEA